MYSVYREVLWSGFDTCGSLVFESYGAKEFFYLRTCSNFKKKKHVWKMKVALNMARVGCIKVIWICRIYIVSASLYVSSLIKIHYYTESKKRASSRSILKQFWLKEKKYYVELYHLMRSCMNFFSQVFVKLLILTKSSQFEL